jgi:Acetyltransferase (GNAT) domain
MARVQQGIRKMKIEILESHSPRWLEVLQQLRHDVYHLPEYVELEAKRNHTKAEAIIVTENENCLFIPYLLRDCCDILGQTERTQDFFDVLSPYGYPGFLLHEAEDNSTNFANLALEQIKQALQAKGVCAAFFRLHPILSDRFSAFFDQNTLIDNGETVSVDLTLSESELWAHTRKGHQSTINKCKRLNLSARVVPFTDYLDEFMDIYNETMDRVTAKKSYYFNLEYFLDLSKLNDKLHLGIVELDGNIICSSLFFECYGIVQAHLGGTRTEFLKYSPFNLLLHYIRLWAKARGNEFLHLGGGLGGSKEDSLYIFKSGFSRQRHTFRTARFVIDQEKYNYLVNRQAQILSISPAQLLESQFFPSYRAG